MPFPTPLSPVDSPAAARRRAPGTLPLSIVAVVLAASAFALPVAGAAVALGLATLALAGAAVQSLRHRWAGATRAEVGPTVARVTPGAVPPDALTGRLHRLDQLHAQKIQVALDRGREDLARELSDTYADETRFAITAAGLPAAGR